MERDEWKNLGLANVGTSEDNDQKKAETTNESNKN